MKINGVVVLLFVLMLIYSLKGAARGNGPEYSHFFTIEKSLVLPVKNEIPGFSEPLDLIADHLENAGEYLATQISLIDFVRHDQAFGVPLIPYNRSEHFGGWIRRKTSESCLNTRGKVLERDSLVPVQDSLKACSVTEGVWLDPYTGLKLFKSADIQIDHLIPLKNAYISGADAWSFEKRCLFSNFLGSSYNLQAIWGPENSKKSDKSIERYLPPQVKFQCQYISEWLKVKYIWKLGLNPYEADVVRKVIQTGECQTKDFFMSLTEEDRLKKFIAANQDLCRPR